MRFNIVFNLFLSLLFFIFSFSVLASENLCEDMYSIVCSDEQKSISNNNVQSYYRYAENVLASRDTSRFNSLQIMSAQKKIIAEYMISKLEDAFSDVNINYIKNIIKNSIDIQNFDVESKKHLFLMIEKVHFYYDKKSAEKLPFNYIGMLEDMYQFSCGTDGIRANASIGKVEGKYPIVVCPGLFMQYFHASEPSISSLKFIGFTMAHEFGHIFAGRGLGSLIDPEKTAYKDLFQCVLDKKENSLLKSSTFGGLFFSAPRVKMHFGEIAADYWGATALALILEDTPVVDQLHTLRTSTAFLCNRKDAGHHPGSLYRIQEVIQNNPYLRDSLSCKSKNKSCYINE